MMLEGTVTCIRHASQPSESSYFISGSIGGKFGLAECKSGVVLQLHEQVSAELEGNRIGSAIIKGKDSTMEGITRLAHERSLSIIKSGSLDESGEIGKTSNRMRKRLEETAVFLVKRILSGAPLIVRFHNDADGSSGAYALYRALKELGREILICGSFPITWKMHRGVAYDKESAEQDILTANNLESASKPVLIIIDFGTSEESNVGIESVKDRFEIIWLDHHPIEQNFHGSKLDHYINPWMFGGDSNYTAGFLACDFAGALAELDLSEERDASLIGDYSSFATKSEKGKRLALLLDMLTSDKRIAVSSGSSDLTPMDIEQILSDKGRRDELTRYAVLKLDEAIDMGIRSIRQYKSDVANVYLLDFENVRASDVTIKYPLPGRYASKLLEHLETLSPKPCVLILHFGSFISVRVGKSVSDKLDLIGAVRELRSNYSDIVAAGGHRNAMSIKMASAANRREITNMLLRLLGCKIA